MSFIGTNTLTTLLVDDPEIIAPYNSERIKNGAYELSLGGEVFLTDSSPRSVKYLSDNEKIEIKPGQFALLLTKEYIKIPKNKIAFISIKAGVKFKGLVNVSGFHVDPGFEGNLLFSVYNAGPSSIWLSNGLPYFPIWFADLDEDQEYKGQHNGQKTIPDDPIAYLSQGELASPNVLSKRIDETEHLKKKIEWVVLAIFGVVVTASVGFTIKFWTDSNKLKEAVEYGYQKKANEIVADSTITKLKGDIKTLNTKVDSLTSLTKNTQKVNK
jgi:dCTP deaminase